MQASSSRSLFHIKKIGEQFVFFYFPVQCVQANIQQFCGFHFIALVCFSTSCMCIFSMLLKLKGAGAGAPSPVV